jgi:hypothetical protein
MANRRVAFAIAALGVLFGVAGVVTIGSNANPDPSSEKQFVQLPKSTESKKATVRRIEDASKLGPSGLSHDKPPPLEALRDYSHAQSVYDQEAKPGDFVTPPAVSIEH